ncbi:MAG: error-prone DNA polymerase [Candidatus Eremiobacter antarcticus]|nr:DNA polymerase III subunit alpha [Candidatus Eremiobacteraeota bacterium]MBC5809146.1 DNA polymerase III subunit alpha [Candidatus Eremiobacteraeota bacterium]PZR61601.1 MAG: error-prone DNA polymerase [Candidatus Eremiobacter sp. RRmetagenome_bin22]PZR68252.1 MAG: error-prone DNA polymerase [Solirubrobacterales bacterium]
MRPPALRSSAERPRKNAPSYAELHAHSNFTLLDGASHPEELVHRAKELELCGIALTDRDALYGAVRFAQAGRDEDIPAIIGAELTLDDGSHLVLLAENTSGYANLSQLISRARLDHPRGQPCTSYDLLARHAGGLIALSGCGQSAVAQRLEGGDFRSACKAAARLRDIFGWGNFWIELQRHLLPEDGPRIRALCSLAQTLELGIVATGGVHYAVPDDRELADVLACIRLKTTLDEAGTRLRPNGEYYLRSPFETARLFAEHPRAVANSAAIAQRCAFRLQRLQNEFPDFPLPADETAFSYLYKVVHEGVQRRYQPVTPAVSAQIAHELAVIEKLDLAGYFLIVWDIVRFARERGILVQGRGSAANSAVCYALQITSVDPVGLKLLFERFLSEERDEPPDIDLDTPSGDQREQLIQYIYQRYGREHAGMVAEVITYQARSAVRDIGKALGLSLDQVDALAKSLDASSAANVADEVQDIAGAQEVSLHERSSVSKHGERLPLSAAHVEAAMEELPKPLQVDLRGHTARRLYDLCRRIDGFPRHLSQHVGGMVITRSPLIELAPLEPAAMPGRTILCWDKDDCAVLGLIKIDVLGLGMLDCIELALAEIERSRGVKIDLADLRACDDERIYEMLCEADTVGLFQVESRAQMATLPRLQPRCFYDIVVQVAIIRPGPIQGDMVHPYIRRRRGLEPVTYPHPKLQPVLERTLGVPLFQEQGMRMAIEAAGFTPGQADELRRAMGHKRSREKMQRLHGRLLEGMERNGIARDLADRLFQMLSAFADYGFPESHAASFALIVYISAYLKRLYAPEFYASLLNAQPMGFYSPSTIIGDARRHNVTIVPPDVNASRFACTIEPLPSDPPAQPHAQQTISHRWKHPVAVRIGLNQVRGIGEKHKAMLDVERQRGDYADLRDFVLRTRLPKDILESLAAVGAFGCFRLARRSAFWDVQRLADLSAAGALEQGMTVDEQAAALPAMTKREEAAADYWGLGLSTRYQIMEFYRGRLNDLGIRRACELAALPNRLVLKVAGIVTTRQRPGTAKGFVFTTMEDETGLVNVIIRPDIYQRYRPIARDEPTVIVEGVLQKQDGHVNVLARRFWKLDNSGLADGLQSRNFH